MRKFLVPLIIACAAAGFLFAYGCAIKADAPEPVKYYVLHYAPPEFPVTINNSEKPVVIHVDRLKTHVPYNSTRIVYAENPHQRSTYAYHQWMKYPADMVASLLLRDIEKSGIADTVVERPSRSHVTHRVEGTIVDFYENDEKAQWEAVLTLRLALIHIDSSTRAEKVIFEDTYREVKPLERNNPLGLARSMSKAMEDVSKQFLADITNALHGN
jgi:ABC-type uncharacterized transport system auxiliary subunit